MAQPDQINPFAAPPSAGGVPAGDPFAQQNPMQSDNPFASLVAQSAPQQQQKQPPPMSNPFSSQDQTAMDSSGNAVAGSAPTVPAQENPFKSSEPSPPPQQGFVPDAAQQQPPQFQQNPQPSIQMQHSQLTMPQQQTFPPQPQPPVHQTPFVQPQQQGLVPGSQALAQQGFAPQPQFPVQQTQQGMQPQFSQQQQQPPQVPTAGVVQPQPVVDPFSNALVPAAQPANPYAAYAQPAVQQQVNPFGASQAMVPVAQQQQPQSQWGVQAGATAAVGSAASFDPFAPPPPAPPAPAPAPPQASTEIVPSPAPQAYHQAADFPFNADVIAPAPEQKQQEQIPESSASVGPPMNEVNTMHGGHSVVSEPETTLTRRSMEDHDRDIVPHQPPAPRPSPQNKYSQELARNAPPGSGPLPKGDLVVKSGYILSRISFRTILMKKWKQSYWVQYGRHTMLWFRSENHFNEWLSNPYLTQAQRTFLVKLAINFVHDLYKPNVRGYQVTQSHTKPYGRKLIRQFKLERWMDYGPTIAAAFGSPDQKEVDELRQTIIDCMRNTPLENGIRATGAVRQESHEQHQYNDNNGYGGQGYAYDDHQPRGQSYEMTSARLDGDAHNRSNAPQERSASAPTGGRSVVSANDLLDDQRVSYDDTASFGGYSTGQQYNNYSQAAAPSSQGPPRQMNQQYAPPQGPPQQQHPYAGYH